MLRSRTVVLSVSIAQVATLATLTLSPLKQQHYICLISTSRNYMQNVATRGKNHVKSWIFLLRNAEIELYLRLVEFFKASPLLFADDEPCAGGVGGDEEGVDAELEGESH